MWNSVVEQFVMLITLLLFYMMISSYIKRIDNTNVENGLIRFFRTKIHAKKLNWIWIFFSCKYIHVIALIYFFFRGIENLNSLNNLGYMVFFVVYTAYEGFYRQTSQILMLFTSFFIVGQYIYSLIYQIYMDPYNR